MSAPIFNCLTEAWEAEGDTKHAKLTDPMSPPGWEDADPFPTHFQPCLKGASDLIS